MLGVAPDMNREPNMGEVLPFVHDNEGVSCRCACAISPDVDSDSEVTGFAIDHRKVARGSVFGAFKGAVFNGEDFIGQAVEPRRCRGGRPARGAGRSACRISPIAQPRRLFASSPRNSTRPIRKPWSR